MTGRRITTLDLDWWVNFAEDQNWTFAKTYAATAPHEYLVGGRTKGVTLEDMVRAARVIQTFGRPGKYYSLTKIYLVSPNGRYRWWTEDEHFTDATLVNRATTELSYGVQNAPSTDTGRDSIFDGVATVWDAEHPITDDERTSYSAMLSAARGTYPPYALDIGCGTGRVLDLGLVAPERYAGVDTSRAMLNMLVRKHPRVAAIYPMDIADALDSAIFTVGQFDWVFLDSDVDLTPAQRTEVQKLARRAVVDVAGSSWTLRDVREETARALASVSGRIRGVVDGQRIDRVGNLDRARSTQSIG